MEPVISVDLNTLLIAIFGAITAIAVALNAFFAKQAAAEARKATATALETHNVAVKSQEIVQATEKNTNSMKDELVREVRAAALLKGAADQKIATAAGLAMPTNE